MQGGPKKKGTKGKKKVKKQVNGTSETRTRERQGPTPAVAIFFAQVTAPATENPHPS